MNYRTVPVFLFPACLFMALLMGPSPLFAIGQTYEEKSEIVKKADSLDLEAKSREELKKTREKEMEARQRDIEDSTQEDKIAKIR